MKLVATKLPTSCAEPSGRSNRSHRQSDSGTKRVSHALSTPGPVLPRQLTDWARIPERPSARGRINENVEKLDPSALDMSDIHTRNGRGAVGRTCLPEETTGAVVARGVSDRSKDESGRQHAVQAVNRFRDSLASGRGRFGVAEGCVLRVEFVQRCEAAIRISLVENTRDVGLHQPVEYGRVHRVCGFASGLLLRVTHRFHAPSKNLVIGARNASRASM